MNFIFNSSLGDQFFTGEQTMKKYLTKVLTVSAFGFSILTNGQPVTHTVQGNFFSTFPTITNVNTIGSRDIATGDINGDGSDDIVSPNSGFVWGPLNSGSFRGHTADEMGLPVDSFQSGSAMPPAFLGYRAITVGDFNNDDLGDVVVLGPNLELLLMPNSGQSKNNPGFTSSVLIDNMQTQFSSLGVVLPAPNVNYPMPYAPVFRADDIDGDGNQDLLISIHFINHWNAVFVNSGIQIYWGNGNGTFQPVQTIPTNFSVLDLEFVDWNGDGTRETFLYLEQNLMYATMYTSYVQFYNVQGRNITMQGQQQFIPATNLTGLAYLKPEGFLNHRIAFSGHSFPNSYTMLPELLVAEFDSSGNWISGPHSIAIPSLASLTLDADFQGIKSGDFNNDGSQDLLVLLETQFLANQPISPAEVFLIEGPIDSYGSAAGISSIQFPTVASTTQNKPLRDGPGAMALFTPNRSSPKVLTISDFNSDGFPDLTVGNIAVPNSTTNPTSFTGLAVIRVPNFNSWGAAGLGSVSRIPGTGSPSPGNKQSRCGIKGGKPVIGNSNFKVSLQDAPHSGVAALWGAYNANPTTYLHLNMAFSNADSYSNVYTLNSSNSYGARLDHNVPIPNNPSLIGTQAYFQWVIADPNSNAAWPVYCSDAIGVTIGQ